MEKIIEVNGVSKTFKHKNAVNNVSFHVNKGEIVALLGPNGAENNDDVDDAWIKGPDRR